MRCLNRWTSCSNSWSTNSTKNRSASGEALLKVVKLTDIDKIEGYLLTFEQQMITDGVETSSLAFLLTPHLMEIAQKDYMALGNEEAGNYQWIK